MEHDFIIVQPYVVVTPKSKACGYRNDVDLTVSHAVVNVAQETRR